MKKNFSPAQGVIEFALLIVLVAIVVIPILAVLNPAIGRTFRNVVDGVVNNDIRGLGSRLTQTVLAATASSTPTLVGAASSTATLVSTATVTPSPTVAATATSTATVIATPAGGWVWCALENDSCAFTGTRQVRYGANNTWTILTLTNTTPCTNGIFGDPLSGVQKACWYFDSSIYPTGTPTATQTATAISGSGWTWCAAEGGNCTFTGTREVKYGASNTWATLTFTNSTDCNNNVFGDPLSGVLKACWYSDTEITPPPAPTITGITPNSGASAGGTAVVISGSDFAVSGTSFTFGGVAATGGITCTSSSCSLTAPAHAAGVVDVMVTVGTSSATATGGYTYIAAPVISSVFPNAGTVAGGTAITISGSGFSTTAGANNFIFGGASLTVTCSTTTTCSAVTPAHAAGAVAVSATVGGQPASLSGAFTYAVPSVSSILPITGATAGGTPVTIVGTYFVPGATTITINGNNATIISCTVTTYPLYSCSATTPAGAAGAVNVTAAVTNGSGTLAGGFTYVAPPVITGFSVATSPVAGTTTTTISGSGFGSTTTFQFGTTTPVSGNCGASTTSCTVTIPQAGDLTAGAITVTPTTNGVSGAAVSGFAYIPTISSLSTTVGGLSGKTVIDTIEGTGFSITAGNTVFKFGANSAAGVSCSSTTICTATTPGGSAAGDVNVTATVNSQVSANLSNGFKYVTACTITRPIPAVPSGSGYYYVINPTVNGQISTAQWPNVAANGRVYFYKDSLAGATSTFGTITLTPPLTNQLPSTSYKTDIGYAPGKYIILFYSNNNVTTAVQSKVITYYSLTCP